MKNLLITTIGKYNHADVWVNGSRDFDIALVNYDGHTESPSVLNNCRYFNKFRTFKYPGVYSLFELYPDLLNYDYYWMPDEDIELSTEDINVLFFKMKQFDIDLAQPSIEKSATSFPSWKIFTHKEGIDIIFVSFIEIMCPGFSKKALSQCLPTFTESQSGWGLDIVWPALINGNSDNIAVINSVSAKHTRPIGGGDLYIKLKAGKISPSLERKKLMRKYGISEMNIKIHE